MWLGERDDGMIGVYRKILDLFDRHERRRFYLLMALMIIVAFAEVLGISTVMLLLGVLAQPEKITESRHLSWAYETLGFTSTFAFQIFLSAGVFVAVMASLVLKALGSWAIIRFSTMRGYTISTRLLQSYLRQPYAWFLEHNSAEIRKSVLNEVDQVVSRSSFLASGCWPAFCWRSRSWDSCCLSIRSSRSWRRPCWAGAMP